MRKVKDAVDLTTNEKIYFKGHAKATYTSEGKDVESELTELSTQVGELSEDVANKVDATYVDNAIASAITNELNAIFNYAE